MICFDLSIADPTFLFFSAEYLQVVEGSLATWENSISLRFKVALDYSDYKGQPLVHLTGFALFSDLVGWPIQRDAPFKPR